MEAFNPLKHKLTKDGRPWLSVAGNPRMLKEGEKNSNEQLAMFNSHGSVAKVSKEPTAHVVDKSVVLPDDTVEQRTSQLVTSQDEIKAMQNELEKDNVINYTFYDRRLEQHVTASYNINEMMNQIEHEARDNNITLTIKNDPTEKTLNMVNKHGQQACLNLSQPVVTLVRHARMFIRKLLPNDAEGGGYQDPGKYVPR
jgi:hypothetical protein